MWQLTANNKDESMKDDLEYINRLFGKYIQDEISEEELEILFKLIKDCDFENFVPEKEIVKYFGNEMEDIIGEDNSSKPKEGRVFQLYTKKIAYVAAAILLIVVSGIYHRLSDRYENNMGQELVQSVEPLDVMPGQNFAVLTSSRGKSIILSETDDGQINTGEDVDIVKVNDGELIYTSQGKAEPDEMIYNTLSTPRGGQYQLTLSDGTKVWLNAASSIRFPVEFPDDERRVDITGEVYFDVAHSEEQTFIVHAGSSVIEDLGTAFNVTAYEDERSVKTTLVEGIVKVREHILSPGEQAIEDENDHIQILKNVDLDNVVSWKDGFFSFENANLAEIMRVLSRWYNLEVDYENEAGLEKRYSGKIDRNLTLLQVLEGLKLTAQNFDIQPGNKIIIRG